MKAAIRGAGKGAEQFKILHSHEEKVFFFYETSSKLERATKTLWLAELNTKAKPENLRENSCKIKSHKIHNLMHQIYVQSTFLLN